MTGTKKILAGFGAVFVLLAVIVAVTAVSISNREVRLRRQLEAQQKSTQVVFDNTWKILQQQAGVDHSRSSVTWRWSRRRP